LVDRGRGQVVLLLQLIQLPAVQEPKFFFAKYMLKTKLKDCIIVKSCEFYTFMERESNIQTPQMIAEELCKWPVCLRGRPLL